MGEVPPDSHNPAPPKTTPLIWSMLEGSKFIYHGNSNTLRTGEGKQVFKKIKRMLLTERITDYTLHMRNPISELPSHISTMGQYGITYSVCSEKLGVLTELSEQCPSFKIIVSCKVRFLFS